MTTMNAAELARNIDGVLDQVERQGDEIVITRDDHPVARLVPGVPRMTAMQALADLAGILTADEGRQWLEDARDFGRNAAGPMRDPWAS